MLPLPNSNSKTGIAPVLKVIRIRHCSGTNWIGASDQGEEATEALVMPEGERKTATALFADIKRTAA
jgi:hypothetical protein